MAAETSPAPPDGSRRRTVADAAPARAAALPDDPRLACASHRPLPAEASARTYVRLHAPVGLGPEAPPRPGSAVLMRFAAGTPPGEVRRVARATERLAEAGLPVPETYLVEPGDDRAPGWIVQEDLGDTTLAALVASGADPADAYDEALTLLGRLAPLSLDTSPRPPLDATRLRDELTLFVRAALPALDIGRPSLGAVPLPPPASGTSPPPGPPPPCPPPPGPAATDAARLDAELDALVARCAARPVETCHRDYHARNLLVHAGRVRVVDHQDAMAGPAGYDRASLAYDPYVERADDLRDALAGDPADLWPVAVQRLAKAIGTYASKGGRWRGWIAPAARQAGRLLHTHGRDADADAPVLDEALHGLAAPAGATP